MRVLKWIVERCEGKAGAAETPIGRMPRFEDMEWEGLDTAGAKEMFGKLTQVDSKLWKDELKDHD
jgi:phosphoenolpyruvate carboxykinase (GTP)